MFGKKIYEFSLFLTVIFLFLFSERIYASAKNKKNFNSFKISGTVGKIQCSFFDRNEISYSDPVLVQLNIKEKSNISKKASTFGEIGFNFSLENQKIPIPYIAYFGLNLKNYGNISYGKNYNILYDILSWTNIDQFSKRDLILLKDFSLNPVVNTITYKNENLFENLKFSFQYQKKNKNEYPEKKINFYNRNKYGASFIFNLNHKIAFGISFIKDLFINKDIFKYKNMYNNSITDINFSNSIYSIGMKYKDNENLYISAIYTKHIKDNKNIENNISVKEKNFISELAIKYKLNKFLYTFINFLSKKDNCIINPKKEYLKNYITFGINYFFNKKIVSFLNLQTRLPNEFKIGLTNKLLRDKSMFIGIIYQF